MADNFAANVRGLLPFSSWEYTTVEFTTPNQDLRVPHALGPNEPYDVRYWAIRKSAEITISDNTQDGVMTQPWRKDYIVLRSNAPAIVELLLFIPNRRG
jgi:hypothetical protein